MTGRGRNDSCSCGSGRKYKRCCGSPAARGPRPAGYTEAERSSAWSKLYRYAGRAEFDSDRAIAETLFWGPDADQFDDEQWDWLLSDSMVTRNFACFLTLDVELEDDRTLLDFFLERRGRSLSSGERRYLEELRETRVGLYEVVGRAPGVGLQLKSLLDEGQELSIVERTASGELERGQLVAARVLRLPSGFLVLDGEIYPFVAEEDAEVVLAELESLRATARAHGRALSQEALLRRASFRFNHLWLESVLGSEGPGSAEARRPGRVGEPIARAYPYLYAYLTDYLDGDMLSDRVPREARRMALYLGRIVAAVSQEGGGEELWTAVDCRRRPSNLPCDGLLLAGLRAGQERVDWSCPSCGDAGTISDWRGTPFDLSGRAPGGRVELGEKDLRQLFRLAYLSGPALTLLVAAWVDGDGVVMEGDPEEFRSLAACIARELAVHGPSRSATRRLVRLHALLSRAGGVEPDLSPGIVEAELFLEERARRPRLALVPSSDASNDGYRVYLRLLDVEPPIWRRLELPSRISLADLNDVLLLAMGWTNSHLHLFEHEGRAFAPPESLEELEVGDSRAVLLGELLRQEGDRLVWEYDLGDSWRHELRVESIAATPPERPRLLDGARACPPEDSGGAPGYAQLLSALADPTHPEHEHLRTWAGPSFDPERFDLRLHDRLLDRLATAP